MHRMVLAIAVLCASWPVVALARHRDTQAVLLSADLWKLEWQRAIVDRSLAPSLGADGIWRLRGKPISIDNHVRTANILLGGRYRVAFVSLGSRATYGQFLKTAMDLRRRKLCDVAILEAGEPTGGQIDVGGITIC
jgi:hypothetical protein